MPTEKIKLRQMRENELPMVKQWAIEEGWNPGCNDLEFCYAAYPKAFYVLEDDGKVVGCTTITRYSEKFAFLGLLVVIPSERQHGYGKNIWDKTMELLKDCETIRFYGVLPRKSFYRPFNFRPIGYNSSYVMDGKHIPEKLSCPIPLSGIRFFKQPQETDVEAMATYEESFLKIRREPLISAFLRANKRTAILAIGEGDKILGYGAIRPCVKDNTFTIKPLYADTYEVAKTMFLELLHRLHSVAPERCIITLDIPLANPHIERLVLEFELDKYIEGTKDCDTAVMSRRQIDRVLSEEPLDVSKVYSRFSLELS